MSPLRGPRNDVIDRMAAVLGSGGPNTSLGVRSWLRRGLKRPKKPELTLIPPARGQRYEVLVPLPDRDGHDLAGIKTVDITVPVGTNTGWNLLAPGPRGADLCGLNGSFFPFATTRGEREESGDPRRSLEERYTDHAGFVEAVSRAAARSVVDRTLLEENAATIITIAEESDILQP